MKYQKFAGKWKADINMSRHHNPVVTAGHELMPVHRPATYVPHGGTAKTKQTYTGSAILGIGTMHKSNAVPVFTTDEACDIAHMRR
jgi:hypothetical protein